MTAVDVSALRRGDRRALAKAITLIESTLDTHRREAQRLLEVLLPATGNSLRIGISGTPGVGKSTFIEVFGKQLIAAGKKVAVLAVDPSSPLAGGSILGDKTRMETLARDANAYIRPSPASGELGGVALKTRESMLLCEAAGFDVILVETVGVGQSEFEVGAMVDFFLLLMQPNAGDDLQGIKKGILELADALIINKADGQEEQAAQQAQSHYQGALDIVSHLGCWQPRVLTCSARENKRIDTVWSMIADYVAQAQHTGEFANKRARQNKQWMQRIYSELIELKMKASEDYVVLREQLEAEVIAGKTTPLLAAQKLASFHSKTER